MVWLARRGMQTMPIPGGADLDREGAARPSSFRTTSSLSPARGAQTGHVENLQDNQSGHLEPGFGDSANPTVLLVVSPDVDLDESRTAESAADPIWEDESASVREWVEALLRKTHPNARDRIRLGPLEIDAARRSVSILTSDIRLTPTEFRLLSYLAMNAGRLVGHTELLSTVWGPGYADDIHLLQEAIRSLRGRIALVTDRPLIESVYGAGYRMAAWAEESPAPCGPEDHAETAQPQPDNT